MKSFREQHLRGNRSIKVLDAPKAGRQLSIQRECEGANPRHSPRLSDPACTPQESDHTGCSSFSTVTVGTGPLRKQLITQIWGLPAGINDKEPTC